MMIQPSFEQTYHDLNAVWEQIDSEKLSYTEDHFRMLLVDLVIELADDSATQ